MNLYECLLHEADELKVDVEEQDMAPGIKGLYGSGLIWINKQLRRIDEKASVMAEEIGHHHTTAGDITDQTNDWNRKLEKRARTWSYYRLMPLDVLIKAHDSGVSNRYEFARFLGVTEEFVDDAITRFQEVYGVYATHKGHMILFEPLMIVSPFGK